MALALAPSARAPARLAPGARAPSRRRGPARWSRAVVAPASDARSRSSPVIRFGGSRDLAAASPFVVARRGTPGSRGVALASAASSDDAASSSSASSASSAPPAREPKRVCIFVEPSPFSHVSGMKNRFLRLIENLVELGDDVVVVTPDRDPPATYAGARVIGVHGFKLPFYPGDTLLLSYARDKRVEALFADPARRPDVLHCSSPGALIWTACGLSEKYDVPLVQSYHTHIPFYIPRYTWAGLVKPMWDFIRVWTRASDVTMVTSSILQEELRGEGCPRLEVWQKGVDTVTFHPKFRSEEMHAKLCGGRPGKVIGVVGRLGAEKNLKALRTILEKCPAGTNLAFVGDGPERAALEKHFEGTNATFMGMMLGDDLAAAYASLDVFVMPSESETLGFVVLEAMASGVPVVAVRAGGLQDILTDTPEVGQLYERDDYAKAAELTTELLTDEREWERQRVSCRGAVERWSWMASNTKLRDEQYAKAFKRRASIDRRKIFFDLVQSRRKIANICAAIIESQWFLQFAGYAFALGGVLASGAAVGGETGSSGFLAVAKSVVAFFGPLGPAAMGTAVALASLVPFVPTQPLFAACGFFFGVTEGAAVALAGALEASVIAFFFARQQGAAKLASFASTRGPKLGAPARRLLKERLVKLESDLELDAKGLNKNGALATAFKLAMYRLAPHVPFTVSNYLLGLTATPAWAFVAGTVGGLAPWCVFYAAFGAKAAGRLAGAGAASASASADAGGLVVFVALALLGVLAQQPWRYHVESERAVAGTIVN
jgi:sulfoquinovosyltransferase